VRSLRIAARTVGGVVSGRDVAAVGQNRTFRERLFVWRPRILVSNVCLEKLPEALARL
jgi:hypothetical protein